MNTKNMKQDAPFSQFPVPRLLDFLRTVPPFETLDQEELTRLTSRIEIAFFPRGQRIANKDDSPYQFLYLIMRGAISVSLTDDRGEVLLVDERGEGDYFGASSLLQDRPPMFDITAQQDLIALMLPAEELRRLVATYPVFHRFFSLSLARTIQAVRQSAIYQRPQRIGQADINLDVFLSDKSVADLMSKDILTCTPDLSVRKAAQLMVRRRVSSIVVTADGETPLGVVTDNDLRSKVVATGCNSRVAVTKIMSRPARTISPDAYAFDALMTMSHHGVRLLVVVENQRMVGIISEHDLQMETGSSPIQVINEIERTTSLDTLIGLRFKIDRVLETLLREGGPVKKLVSLVTELNDRLTYKIIKLVEQEMEGKGLGAAPAPYSWIALGSEGRREQTLHTDQDNALFYAHAADKPDEQCRKWFLRFAERVVDCLERSGISSCPGDFMASNSKWCQPEESWRSMFLSWITEPPSPENLLMASVFFDFRPIYAGTDFPHTLQDEVLLTARKNLRFRRFMAKNALSNRPPLSLLKRFVVERSGEHKNKFDLKMRGLTPVVDAARILSLDLMIKAQNTFDRLDEINQRGVIDKLFHDELREAYEFFVYLQIRRHLEALAKGETPDNFVNPESLNSLQRKMLKESFAVVSRLQGIIENRFQTRRLEL